MSETYSVVMTGGIAEGLAQEQAKANVAKLFNLGNKQLDKLFSGKPVAVRRGVSRQQADKIYAALTKAGVIAKIKSDRPLAVPVKSPAPAKAVEVGSEKVEKKPRLVVANAADAGQGNKPDLECPRCGHHQAFTRACGLCKMDLNLHIQRLERKAQARAYRRQARAAN